MRPGAVWQFALCVFDAPRAARTSHAAGDLRIHNAETSHGSKVPSGDADGALTPAGRFVVGGSMAEAAVENADEAVGQRSQGLAAVGALGAVLVVVVTGTW